MISCKNEAADGIILSRGEQMSKNKKKAVSKAQERRHIATRNWLAIHAHNRNGGAMLDRKKEANKNACRKRISE
jgi:hypothetical protein